MTQQGRQQSEQYHRQQVEELMGDLRQPQQTQQVDENQRRRIQDINEAGRQFAQTIVQNTQAGTEQEEAVKRTVEACQWSAVSVLHHQQQQQQQQNR